MRRACLLLSLKDPHTANNPKTVQSILQCHAESLKDPSIYYPLAFTWVSQTVQFWARFYFFEGVSQHGLFPDERSSRRQQ